MSQIKPPNQVELDPHSIDKIVGNEMSQNISSNFKNVNFLPSCKIPTLKREHTADPDKVYSVMPSILTTTYKN